MKLKRRLHGLSRFSVRQLFLLMLLAALIAGVFASSLNKQPLQTYEAMCFSQDGKRLALLGDGNTQIFDVETQQMLAWFPLTGDFISGRQIAAFIDNDTLVTFYTGRQLNGPSAGIYSFSIAENKIACLKKTTIFSQKAAVSPAGFVIRDEGTLTAEFYDIHSDDFMTPTWKSKVRNSDDRIWLSNDGKLVALFSGFFQSRGPGDPRPVASSEILSTMGDAPILIDDSHASVIVSPDRQMVLLSTWIQSGVRLIELNTKHEIWHYEHAYSPEDMRFSNDGTTVAFEGISNPQRAYQSDRFIVVLDVATGKEKLRVDCNDNMASAFAVSPDGKQLAVAPKRFEGHGVEVWDVGSKTIIGRYGISARSYQLYLFPLLAFVWPLAWIFAGRSKRELQTSSAKKSPFVTFFLISLWLAGLLLAGYIITADLIAVSNFGAFGRLPWGTKALVIGFSTISILTAEIMMVLGLSGLYNRHRNSRSNITPSV